MLFDELSRRRSTWCAENTNFPREVCEHALAHQLPDNVEAAYLRTNDLEKQRTLMEEWGEFASGAPAIRYTSSM